MFSTTQPPDAQGSDDVLGVVLSAVRDELKALVDVPVWPLDAARLSTRLDDALAVKASINELVARIVAESRDRDLPRSVGASSISAHLTASHRMSTAAAAQTVSSAKALHGPSALTEPTRRAQAFGEISAEQARIIAEAVHRLSPDIDPAHVEAAQVDLIRHAQELTLTQLRILANRLVEVVDPDRADELLGKQLREQEERARQVASFTARRGADGIARGAFRIPNHHLGMLQKVLDAYASPRRAGATDGISTSSIGEELSNRQRSGRALMELIEHVSGDGLPKHGATDATIVVRIDDKALRGAAGAAVLDTGDVVSAEEVRRLACNAGIAPAVYGGDSAILDLGMTRRLFTRYQRLALAVRDEGCVFGGCERPPAWCEAHHALPWSRGGPTDLGNGCLLCCFHHHLVHGGEWTVVMAPDGIPEIVPPERVDPQRRPIRHERFKPRAG